MLRNHKLKEVIGMETRPIVELDRVVAKTEAYTKEIAKTAGLVFVSQVASSIAGAAKNAAKGHTQQMKNKFGIKDDNRTYVRPQAQQPPYYQSSQQQFTYNNGYPGNPPSGYL